MDFIYLKTVPIDFYEPICYIEYLMVLLNVRFAGAIVVGNAVIHFKFLNTLLTLLHLRKHWTLNSVHPFAVAVYLLYFMIVAFVVVGSDIRFISLETFY